MTNKHIDQECIEVEEIYSLVCYKQLSNLNRPPANGIKMNKYSFGY